MANAHIAKLMWDAYAIQAGGKTFDGKPLPTWDELGEDRQSCWIAAASVTADQIEKLEAALREIAEGYVTEWSLNTFTNMLDVAQILSEKIQIARKALEGKDD